jgi:hypothetical protein
MNQPRRGGCWTGRPTCRGLGLGHVRFAPWLRCTCSAACCEWGTRTDWLTLGPPVASEDGQGVPPHPLRVATDSVPRSQGARAPAALPTSVAHSQRKG